MVNKQKGLPSFIHGGRSWIRTSNQARLVTIPLHSNEALPFELPDHRGEVNLLLNNLYTVAWFILIYCKHELFNDKPYKVKLTYLHHFYLLSIRIQFSKTRDDNLFIYLYILYTIYPFLQSFFSFYTEFSRCIFLFLFTLCYIEGLVHFILILGKYSL